MQNEWLKAGVYVVSGISAFCVGGFIGGILSLSYLGLFI